MERIHVLNFWKFSRLKMSLTLVAFASTDPSAYRVARLRCESGTGSRSPKLWNFSHIKAKIIRYARASRLPLLLILNGPSYRLMPYGYTHPTYQSSRKTMRACKHIHFHVLTTTNHRFSSSTRPSRILLSGVAATGTFYYMSLHPGRGKETRAILPWFGTVPYYSLEGGTRYPLCFYAWIRTA